MNITESLLPNNEKVLLTLRSIYQSYGYLKFKMKKFEEYDLYVKSKDFLISDNIITFTDTNGKLMALKPDVTLSIIKNLKEDSKSLQKFYYSENVYRVSKDTHTYKELMQTGIECIGDIDLYSICEVLLIAYKSLSAINDNFVLSISHIGIILSVLENFNFTAEQEKTVFKYIGEKNLHGIENLCQQTGANENDYATLINLISSYGTIDSVVEKLKSISINSKMDDLISELENICNILKLNDLDNIQIDFSIINGMNYYNGLVFQGFIAGIPSAILSGGRYDKLLQKMNKYSKAIGFAFYINLLEYLKSPEATYDVDILLLYDNTTDLKILTEKVQELTFNGYTVQVQKLVPETLRYKKLLKIKDRRLEIVESNN